MATRDIYFNFKDGESYEEAKRRLAFQRGIDIPDCLDRPDEIFDWLFGETDIKEGD